MRALVALVVCMTMAGGTSTAFAQDGEIVVEDTRAVVSVVANAPIVRGSANNGGPPGDWPYTCQWHVPITIEDPASITTTTPTPGWLYVLICEPRPGSGRQPINQFEVYNPADPVPGEPGAVTSIAVREFAEDFAQPPPLGVGISPEFEQITGLETWFWPAGATDPIQAAASAGGLTVTVEARWRETTFDVGEPGADEVRCTEVIEWSRHRDETACAHTYLTEERGRTVVATSSWDFVWWDNAGQPVPAVYATVDLVEQLDVDVIDLEAVITNSR